MDDPLLMCVLDRLADGDEQFEALAYKLLEPIGEGGMGTVWMAQQLEPVKRLVAIKLIKPGMDSK
jgi:serine/threonine protein kinase